MLIIRAKEGNTNLSHVLRKNPQTSLEKGGFKSNIGTGVYYGYFPINEGIINPNEFHLRFIPSKEREELGSVEQFPINHITDPIIIKGLISNLLRSAWKEPLGIDGPVELEFFLFSKRNLQPFQPNIVDCSHTVDYGPRSYQIKQEFPTLFQGLNWLLALTYHLTNDLNKEDCIKASINCNNAGLDYHPRYLISKMTPYHQLFNTDTIKLDGGPTYLQRRNAIYQVLKNTSSNHLIDLGAGSLYVTRRLVSLYDKVTAVDKEFGYKTKLKAKELKVELVESLIEHWDGNYEGADVILSEVLEHNPKDIALSILTKVLEGKPNTVVITVPNKGFNVNFHSQYDMRHEDHDWEPTWEELDEFLPSVPNYDYVIKGIGDKVDDENITLMAVYEIRK
jgi:hypothetical protein